MAINVFTARTVITMYPEHRTADTVAVENGRIIAVGNRAEVHNVMGDRLRSTITRLPDAFAT